MSKAMMIGMVGVFLVGVCVGLAVDGKTQDHPAQPPSRTTEGERKVDPGAVFIIKTDPYLGSPMSYSSIYSEDAEPLQQWKNHQSLFTFKEENRAKKAHDAVAAVLREEMRKAMD